jgi:hypothetical protein
LSRPNAYLKPNCASNRGSAEKTPAQPEPPTNLLRQEAQQRRRPLIESLPPSEVKLPFPQRLAPNATHFGLIIKFLSSPPCGGMIFALPALARNLRKRIGPVDHCQFVRGHGCLRILF